MLITHEWVEPIGGSENVFRELLATFPEAEAACLWNNAPESFDRPVRESRLATGILKGRKALSLPAHPSVWRSFPLGDHDTVLASSHAFGHHIAARAARVGRRGFAYVHTPARYIWAPEVEARGRGVTARCGSVVLRPLDRRATDERVHYAANSRFIRDRIQRAWGRESAVIYPPVNVERIRAVSSWRDELSSLEAAGLKDVPSEPFLLGASRLVSYKRLDLVIDIGNRLGMPVVIAGTGPAEFELRRRAEEARVPVVFVGRVSDAQLYALYQQAALFVFLPVEDFGIMPVEAMAAGTPVLVNAAGGAAESVNLISGGMAVDVGQPLRYLVHAGEAAMALSGDEFGQRTDTFSVDAFRARVRSWLDRH